MRRLIASLLSLLPILSDRRTARPGPPQPSLPAAAAAAALAALGAMAGAWLLSDFILNDAVCPGWIGPGFWARVTETLSWIGSA